jgi:hypothetical protein
MKNRRIAFSTPLLPMSLTCALGRGAAGVQAGA